jgi:microcystin degradation protein MlrC
MRLRRPPAHARVRTSRSPSAPASAAPYNERTQVTGRVERLFDGDVVYTHAVNRGHRAATGPAAVVAIGGVDVVVHSRSVGAIDPALYLSLGADPAAYAVLQAKSHISFKAGFAALTDRSVVADTPGPTSCNLPTLPYRRRPHPLYPFEDPSPSANA